MSTNRRLEATFINESQAVVAKFKRGFDIGLTSPKSQLQLKI